MDLGLRGKVAAVAAASKGLGRACALELAREGARVAICARGGEALERTRDELEALSGEAVAVACDLDTPDGPPALVEAAVARWGRLDVLVANNGGPPVGAVTSVDDAAWQLGFQRTFLSTMRFCRAALPHLERAAREPDGFGRIVAITSFAVKEPIDDLAISNAIRSAVSGALKTLARELGPKRITVNQLCPGRFATERILSLGATAAGVPAGRLGDPAEFGAVVAFVCSARASYLTGATILVDGGLTRSVL